MKNERLIFEVAKERGWHYDPLTGVVMSHTGNIPKCSNKKTNKKTGLNYEYILCGLSIDNKVWKFLSHRFGYWWVTGEIHEQIDHIKHCEDPHQMNIFTNLRPSNSQKNSFNRECTKGYHKRVYKSGEVKYRAKIHFNGEQIHLGYFKSPEEAREAYLKAKSKYHLQ